MIEFYQLTDYGTIQTPKWDKNVWVNVTEPDEKDKNFIINNLSVPQAFWNDVQDIDERPRVESEDGWLFVVLRIPTKQDNEDLPYSTVPLGIILKGNIVLTLIFFQTELLTDFVHYTVQKKIAIKNGLELLMRLFISSSVWFSKYLKQINKSINLSEQILDKKINNETLQNLFALEKSLIYFTTTLADHTFLFRRLITVAKLKQNIESELIDDVEIELMQAQTTTKIAYDILRRMEDSYDSQISNNLNIVMKHLTSISIILMIPTLIASFYGMNVPNHLEHNPIAFAGLIIGSFFLSIVSFVFFKKIDWF